MFLLACPVTLLYPGHTPANELHQRYLGQKFVLLDDGSTLKATLQVFYGGGSSTKPVLVVNPGAITGGNCNGSIDISLQ